MIYTEHRIKQRFCWFWSLRIGLVVLVAVLFFIVGYANNRDWVSVGGLLPIAFSLPFILGLIVRRMWIVFVSPAAWLLTIAIWQLTYATYPLSYDMGILGWLVGTLVFVFVPMLASF